MLAILINRVSISPFNEPSTFRTPSRDEALRHLNRRNRVESERKSEKDVFRDCENKLAIEDGRHGKG